MINVHRSSYYKWKATAITRAARIESDALLGTKISTVFAAEKGLYGAKRITAVLNAEASDRRTNHKRVGRIMKALGFAGFRKKRRVTTTQVRSCPSGLPRSGQAMFYRRGAEQSDGW